MNIWDAGQKIAIWGTGKVGKRQYYKLRERFEITAFIDNNEKQKELFGIPVIQPISININQYRIVICSVSYREIEEQCRQMNLYLYEHFIPYVMMEDDEIIVEEIWKYAREESKADIIWTLAGDRACVYIHGNCQINVIKRFLKHAPDFHSKYIFLKVPPINENREKNLLFENMKHLTGLKLLLTQCISANNGYDCRFATENMIGMMREIAPNLKIIKIPNLFFDVYFPQGGHMPNRHNVLVNELGAGVFPYPDLILDDLSKRYSGYEIKEIVTYMGLFDKTFLVNYVSYRLSELEVRERECDIKMLDYIQEHYREEQLFYSRNHPINKVIKELTIRILSYMGLSNRIDYEEEIPSLDQWQEFIYPSVFAGLELKFDKAYYIDGDSIEKRSLDEIVLKYVSYCYGK